MPASGPLCAEATQSCADDFQSCADKWTNRSVHRYRMGRDAENGLCTDDRMLFTKPGYLRRHLGRR